MPYDDPLPFKVVHTNGHDELVPVRLTSSSAEPPMRRHGVSIQMTVSITAMGRGPLPAAIDLRRMVSKIGACSLCTGSTGHSMRDNDRDPVP
jgi:hypothetical protein